MKPTIVCFICSRVAVLLLCGLLIPSAIHAQASATINGTVIDASGAVVPHASVTALNLATNVSRSTETNETGTYSIASLAPGSYDVSVAKTGLKTTKFAGVVLTVDQALTLDVRLEVSGTSQTVVVESGQIAPINTTDAQISTVVEQKQIQDLPLILRDPYQLVLLTPGATQTNSGLGGFSINGAREQQNNFLLDGTNNNDPGVPGSGFALLNPDDTEEFRVITNNYLPEFGRNAGSIIDIITRSGTNDFHGDVYYFGRWDALGARDYFNTPDNGPKNPYVRNIFGTSIGGPIKKNKVFYFFNYEGQRFATTTQAVANVPAGGFSTGNFVYTDPVAGSLPINVSTPTSANNAFALALDPQVQKLLNFYPAANGGPVLPGISANYFFPNADLANNDSYLGKVDFNITSTNVLSVRYLANSGNDNGASTNILPGIGGAAFNGLTQSLNGHLSSQVRPNLLNDLFASANRSKQVFSCVGSSLIDSLSLGGLDPFGRGRDWFLPGFTPIACLTLGDSNGQARPFGTYNIGDNITWTKGRHTWKFGFEFADNYTNDFDNFFTRSTPSFAIFSNTLVSALAGTPATAITVPTAQDAIWGLLGGVFQETQTQNFASNGAAVPSDERGFRERDIYGFFQDQFKLASNFTLSYGLRYEWDGVPWVVNDQLTNATPAALSGDAPIVFNTVTRGGSNPLYTNDVKGFEPRIGFAWDPFKNGKTSVRAGYGIFRDREFFNLTGDTRNNPPFSLPYVNTAFQDFGPSPADQIANIPIPATQPAPGNTLPNLSFAFPATIDPNFHVAYVQQRNLGIQRELGHNFTLEVNYVGNKGNRLLRVIDGNPPIPALVAELRAFCQKPNAFHCIDGPTATTVQGANLYVGAEEGILPFDAVNNNAAFHSNLVASIANSNYNGLQTTLTHQFAHNISFQANYTWAHAIDDASDALFPQVNNTVFPADTNDLRPEKGNSSFDVRHRFVANFRAELPFGRGKARLNEGLIGTALEGWSWSGIVLLQTAFPYDIFAPGDDSNGTGATQRADYDANGTRTPPPTNPSGPVTGPNPGLFSFPAFGGPGNLTRNQFYGPGFKNFDMVFVKTTHITERLNIEFRAEAYNVFNHPNFAQPDNLVGDLTFSQSLSELGRNDGTTGSRQLQFGLKLHF